MLKSLEPFDEDNQTLASNVHPSDWVNPTAADRYNLVVIGAGTAGLVSAAVAAALGAKVALIERELMGGDCLNVGCVPSKGIIRASRVAAEVRRAASFGVKIDGKVDVDFAAAMNRMRHLRAHISHHDSARRFQQLGVDVFFGQASFSGPDSVTVDGQTLRFKKAVIATGARAAKLPIAGWDDVGVLTNETVFSLTTLPQRMVVIGGGPIGSEMAQAFARFGAHVTLIEKGPHILTREDSDAAMVVQNAMTDDGIDVRTHTETAQMWVEGTDKVVAIRTCKPTQSDATAESPPDEYLTDEIRADAVLAGIGRQPNVEGLNLDHAGVEFDSRTGVHVDDYLRTTNRRIFAAGDICSAYKFTHAADFMARIVVQNALFMGRKKFSSLVIPWCTYTEPELAHIGMSAAEAQHRGVAIDTYMQPMDQVDRAILDGQTDGFVKIHTRRGTDRIVGATIVAAGAGDLIGELSVAMTHGIGLSKLANAIHPYPTQAEAIRKAADGFTRTRMTPTVQRLMKTWLNWTR